MSNPVGSATIIVSPDSSGFGDELAAQLAPAFAAIGDAAEAAAAAAIAAMGEIGTSAEDIMSSAGAASDSLTSVGDAAQTAGQEATTGFSGVGEAIDAASVATVALGVALGEQLSGAIDSALGKLGDLAGAMPTIGAEFDDAFDRVRIRTGEFGDQVGGMQDSIRELAKKSPDSLDDISLAVSALGVRMDQTGKPLQDLSEGVLRLSQLTGSSLQGNIDNVAGVFKGFGVEIDDQVPKLNELFRVFQATGIPVNELTSAMLKAGPVARLANVSFDDTAAIMGLLTKSGLKAGQSQIAFAKILKYSTSKGLDAKTGFKQVWKEIQGGAINAEEAFKIFGVRSIGMFEAIKSGRIPFDKLSAAIQAGGDTLDEAGAATDDWKESLLVLTNTLKLELEPIARFVFGTISTALLAVSPAIVALAHAVIGVLTPGFQLLVRIFLPVWGLLDKIRSAVEAATSVFFDGASAVERFAFFFSALTGNAAIGETIVTVFTKIGDAVTFVWDALKPVRDLFSTVFNTISDWIAENPVAQFVLLGGAVAGLGAFLSAILAPALALVAGLLAPIIASIVGLVGAALAAAAPFILAALAIAAFVIVVKKAYDNIKPFHDLVDRVAAAIKGGLLAAFNAVQGFINSTVVPAFRRVQEAVEFFFGMLDSGSGVLESFSGALEELGLDSVAGFINGTVIPAFRRVQEAVEFFFGMLDSGSTILESFTGALEELGVGSDIAMAVGEALGSISDALIAVWDAAQPVADAIGKIVSALMAGDWSAALDGLKSLGPALLGLGGSLLNVGVELIKNLGAGLLLGLSSLKDFLTGPVLTWIVGALQSAADTIGPYVGPVLSAIGNGIVTGLTAAKDFLTGPFVQWVGSTLQSAAALIGPYIGPMFTAIKDGIVTGLAAAKDFLTGPFATWVGGAISAIGSLLGPAITTMFTAIKDAVVTGVPAAKDFLVGPFVDWVKGALSAAGTALGAAVDAAGPILTGIKDALVTALGAAATALAPVADAIVSGLKTALVTAMLAVKDLPIIGPLADALKVTVIAAIKAVGNIGDLFKGLFALSPADVGAALGGLGDTIKEGLIGVLATLPTLIGDAFKLALAGGSKLLDIIGPPIVDAIMGLPEKMGAALNLVMENLPGLILTALNLVLKAVGTVFGDWLPAAISGASDLIQTGIAKAFDFLKNLPTILGTVLKTAAIGLIGGLLIALKLALFDIPKWIITEMIPAIGKAIVEHGPDVLRTIGDLIGKLPALLGSILSGIGGIALTFLTGFAETIASWAQQIGTFIIDIAVQIPGWLGGLITGIVNWVVENGPGIALAFADFAGKALLWIADLLISLPGKLAGLLLAIGSWVVENGPGLALKFAGFVVNAAAWILDLITSIPMKLAGLLLAIGNWVVENGPGLALKFAGFVVNAGAWILDFIIGLPGKLFGMITAIGSWVIQNGPTLALKFAKFVGSALSWIADTITSLPGKLLGILTGIGNWIIFTAVPGIAQKAKSIVGAVTGWIHDAVVALPGKLGELATGIINWVKGLGTSIADAAKGLWSGISDGFKVALNFLIDKWNDFADVFKITIPEITIPGTDVKFGGGTLALPKLNHFAHGAIVDSPTLAMLGEGRRKEVVLPLENPQRALSLALQSGLASTLAAALGGMGGGNTYIINGVTWDQVEATVKARDEAVARVRV